MYKFADFGRNYGMAVSPVFRPVEDKIKYLNTQTKTPQELETVIKEADLVLLGGGADIHPSMYGHKNVASHCYSETPSKRDAFESSVVDYATHYKKPILGICRGAQMVCIKSGGWLVQHVDGHTGPDHELIVPDFFHDPMVVNSVHHQMMVPPKRGSSIIGWSGNRTNKFLFDNTRDTVAQLSTDKNPEVVLFSNIGALGIQGHPEFIADPMNEFVVFTRKLLTCFFNFNF